MDDLFLVSILSLSFSLCGKFMDLLGWAWAVDSVGRWKVAIILPQLHFVGIFLFPESGRPSKAKLSQFPIKRISFCNCTRACINLTYVCNFFKTARMASHDSLTPNPQPHPNFQFLSFFLLDGSMIFHMSPSTWTSLGYHNQLRFIHPPTQAHINIRIIKKRVKCGNKSLID